MKKAKNVKAPSASETDLRRWCIEQAIRWPVEHYPGYAAAQGLGPMPSSYREADIIGRAQRIRAWVVSA